MKNKYWLPLLCAAIMVIGIMLGITLGNNFHTNRSSEQKLLDVLRLVHDNYVDEVSMDSLVEMTIPVVLANLDPHSSYIASKDLEAANADLEGKISGIGITFQMMNDTINVMEVVTGGPSEKIGLLPGDRIIEVDGKNVAGRSLTSDEVMGMLRGEKGTTVNITVKRNTAKKPLKFEIVRDDIPVESIDAAYMLDEDTGYIRLARFARNTYIEFLQAVNKLRLEGAIAFVIDLRYNGGGYMEPAVMIANEFLGRNNVIVSTRGRDGIGDYIRSDGTGAFQDYDVAILLNEFSASASEIFSGAIQDNDRGWIIGRRSFGKGLVQQPIMLPDSSEMRLTIQRYYTPSGRSIQKEYKPGANQDYADELVNRFNKGEALHADSIKQHTELEYHTMGGRTVYGGGGIMPDLFVPDDTSGVTSYYVNVANQNLISKFAYEYSDLNRAQLEKCSDVSELLSKLPSDYVLLNSFVQYAASKGVAARWYYINISSKLIVNQIKAMIARDIMGTSAYYQVVNAEDNTVQQALQQIKKPLIPLTE